MVVQGTTVFLLYGTEWLESLTETGVWNFRGCATSNPTDQIHTRIKTSKTLKPNKTPARMENRTTNAKARYSKKYSFDRLPIMISLTQTMNTIPRSVTSGPSPIRKSRERSLESLRTEYQAPTSPVHDGMVITFAPTAACGAGDIRITNFLFFVKMDSDL
jgi:hypothetical protein